MSAIVAGARRFTPLLFGGAIGAAIIMSGVLEFLLVPAPEQSGTVVKVCRDGTLVVHMKDDEFRIVRPSAQAGWRAVGPNVCP